jgi:hypothetical protein
MANNLGRISGQLLKENLTRNGNDLAFDDLGTTEPVLKLNVTNRYVSVNSDTTLRDLFVNGSSRTPYLEALDELIGVSSFKVSASGNTIVSTQETSPGSGFTVLNFSGATQVTANIIDTDNIRLNDNVISTKTLNTNLDFAPVGSLDVYNKLNVTGNLWAKETTPGTGNITLDGNIIFGSDGLDTISFAADINTDINPNEDQLYSIGSATRKWESLYIELVNGAQVSTDTITSGSVDLASRQGKIWYVATTGLDTNFGNHQSSTFATIKHALSQASNGDTVYIYPGIYTEQFPLTVPVGVAVKGTGIRSVTVQPTVPTQSNNAFLLNGESTVSDLTVKDFYAPGYAFSFAPGFTVTTRSPYVQNITVLTKGSVTSPTDPRGFDEGDAGGGAYVDGSLATSASKEASMLFHSVTFITPNADALVMTNGVRIEWLNSFTYFANRGLYAITGSLGLASLGVRFGAELRSIGSANVYGNYGAEANGASTLMYLIQHNFAYIGAGKDVTNDPSLNIAANETVELASGKIYYQSLDNTGNFKVGDAFGVSFDTGLVTISGVSVTAGGVTSINFASGTDETVIDATQVTTGNVKFSNNLLTTLSGAINLSSGTDEINLNTDTSVSDNLDIVGNFNIDGTLTIGNAFIDVVRFEAPVEFDLRPKTDDDYTLGGPTNKRWDVVYLDTSYIGSYKLENATISTLPTDADIELRADGTGRIFINQDNAEFDLDLTVDTTTALKTTIVTGEITHVGDYLQTGNTIQTGNREITNTLDVTNNVYFDNINIVDNRIFTTNSNDNLELRAVGTGIVIFDDNTQFSQAALIGTLESNGLTNSGTITSNIFTDNDIEINDNYITTTVGNNNLILTANGTGGARLEKLRFNSTTLSTDSSNDNITFSVPAGSVLIDAATALKVPVGTTGDRSVLTQGEFRFSTTEQLYKGFNTTSITFGGVYSANKLTNVLAHPTNNTLVFTTNNSTAMTMSSVGITLAELTVDNNLKFNTNTIAPTTLNDNIQFAPNGNGAVVIDDWAFYTNEIVNQNLTTPLTFQNTGNGYLAFAGTSGLVIPVGDTASQPANPELGDLRYNTELEVGEIFNGIEYRSIAETAGNLINEQESQDISALMNLIFG